MLLKSEVPKESCNPQLDLGIPNEGLLRHFRSFVICYHVRVVWVVDNWVLLDRHGKRFEEGLNAIKMALKSTKVINWLCCNWSEVMIFWLGGKWVWAVGGWTLLYTMPPVTNQCSTRGAKRTAFPSRPNENTTKSVRLWSNAACDQQNGKPTRSQAR